MNQSQIIELQRRIGTNPDGYWGPKSIAACQRHLKALMPMGGVWPSPEDGAMVRFFGRPGDESNLVSLDVTGLGVKYDGHAVRSIRCHELVADSLGRILRRISDSPHRGILAKYAGCYNPRTMRGGNRPSKHSWGAAIDLDPDHNGLKTSWPVAATMPIEVMEEFAREGWIGLGWRIGRDSMHFQPTR
jgi:hypothetical protein